MTRQLERGEGNLDAILILAFVIFVMLVTPRGPEGTVTPGTVSGPAAGGAGSAKATLSSPSLVGAADPSRSLSLTMGNAPYEEEAYREYITLTNWGATPIDITGWTLKNGKDQRSFAVGYQLERYSADVAVIPKAAPVLLPSGASPLQDVVLKRGERAVITTGSIGVHSPYAISSFKENMCTGYLENLSDYSFDPPLATNCLRPAREPGLEGLDTECRLFAQSLRTCGTPQFQTKDSGGQPCDTCLNGKRLSEPCAAFIKSHFSYQGCLAYHEGDAGFGSGDTWRVFLGRAWEMWDKNYETIELFDRAGRLIAAQNY